MKCLTTILAIILISGDTVFGQDIKGGGISFRHVSGDKYTFDIYLYTQTSKGISHDSIVFIPGDGGNRTISGTQTVVAGDNTIWHYTTNHTYPGSGTYIVSMLDSFRIANIKNIIGSSGEYIYLESELNIKLGSSINSSPILSNSSFILNSNGGIIYYNPGAYDSDGDSLAFSLAPTFTSNYTFPPGATIDPNTGLFQMPYSPGVYAINIEIDEFRFGSKISTTYREMLIDSSTITTIGEEVSRESDFVLYPNPTTGEVTIELMKPVDGTIEIYNPYGSRIYQKEVLGESRLNISLDPDLETGVYLIKLITEDLISTQKLILN